MSYIQKRGKNTAWRESLTRNLISELIIHEALELTQPRAQLVQRKFDRLIILAKDGSLASRRNAAKTLRNIYDEHGVSALDKLFTTLAERYRDRVSGFTRIIKIENRRGDNANMVVIELLK